MARIAVAALYLLTAAVSLAILAVRILGIRRLRRRSRITDCGAYAVAENPRVGTPFSFLRTVFLGEGYEGRRREIVVCHEASHVRHRHSAERIALELVRSVFWFNPFVWIAGRWLSEVQEWEADRDVLDAGYGLTEYRTIIFRQLFGYNPDIACGLNHSLTKKRFAMMTQFTRRRFAFVRFGAAIPVVAGMMMLCSFTTKTSGSAEPGTASRIHISADGTVTFNGRPVSIDRLAGYVAAERAKLPESDRADMQVLLTSDVSGSPAALVGKTVTFGAAGQLEVLRSDRAYPSDVRTMIFAGNVQARFRDETPDPSLKDVLTEIRCDSLVVNPAGRNFECFDAGFSNASMLSFGKWYRFLADDSGLGWSREMENVMETSLNTALIQVLPDGNILLNGGPVSVAELEPKLVAWRGERSPADVGAWIIAGKEAKMGVVTDIKQALRAANILRVMYNGTDERMVMRMLPPRSASSPGVNVVADVLAVVPGSAAGEDSSTVRSEIRVRERNVFLVLLNGNGKMMVGTADALELIDPRELTSRVGTQCVRRPRAGREGGDGIRPTGRRKDGIPREPGDRIVADGERHPVRQLSRCSESHCAGIRRYPYPLGAAAVREALRGAFRCPAPGGHAGRSAEDFRSRTPRFPVVGHPTAAGWQLAVGRCSVSGTPDRRVRRTPAARHPLCRIAASDRRQTAFRPPLFRIATPDRRQPTHG